jgi:hypothetical protein
VSATETRNGQTDPTLNLDAITGRNAGSGTVQVNVIARNDPPLIAATEAAADPSVASPTPGYAGAARTGANQVLTVVEGGTGDITSSFLQAVDSDNDTLQRQYRITVATAFGGINLNGVPQGAGSTFTQKDIDDGQAQVRAQRQRKFRRPLRLRRQRRRVCNGLRAASTSWSRRPTMRPRSSHRPARSTSTARLARTTRWARSWWPTPNWRRSRPASPTSCRSRCACSPTQAPRSPRPTTPPAATPRSTSR